MREEIIKKVLEKKVVAIVRGVYGEDCLKLAKALHAGGVDLLEVTFDQSKPKSLSRTSDTVKLLCRELGEEMVFGAGTVTSLEMLKLAVDAGAKFIVSPDTNEEVIKATVAAGLVSMPGAMTPTEILTAHRYGADFVKVFPTSNLGAAYIKAICAPLSHIRLLAVGGITAENIPDYRRAGVCGFGVSSNIVREDALAQEDYAAITALARRYTAACAEERDFL